MEEILLTHDEMADAINAAWGDEGCIVTCDDLEVGDFALCCAQVAKVLEWAEKNNIAKRYAKECDLVVLESDLLLSSEDVQALRAAGGEE